MCKLTHLIVLLPVFLPGQLVISEVQFKHSSPNEFVEIYNTSNIPVSVAAWEIADKFSIDQLTGDDLLVPAFGYAVILEGDYDDIAYQFLIPEETTLLYVDDSSIGNGLGNTSDSLFLINASGVIISQMGWNTTVDELHSLEKVVLDYGDIPQNWRQSLSEPGTPGFENSVASQEIDLGIIHVNVLPEYPHKFENYQLEIILCNNGLFETTGNLLINQIEISEFNINPFDTLFMVIDQTGLSSGIHPQEIIIVTTEDFNPENDQFLFDVKVNYEYGDLLINEIMYDPITGDPEWVELFNFSNADLDIFNWQINDDEELQSESIQLNLFVLSSGYAVISKDSSESEFVYYGKFPGLNNTEDDIYLFDFTGTMIDHVHYNSDWGGGNGFSLERITHFLDSNESNNWGTSVDLSGSTPLEQNSLFIETIETQGTISLSPNPFSPDDDGYEDELIIGYSLPFTQSYLTMKIFDSSGRELITLIPGEAVSQDGVVRWNGRFENNTKARIGQYILYVHATSRYSHQEWKSIERIILARRLN